MDNREALFGGGNRRPLPGRQVQPGRPGAPGGYSPVPPRQTADDPRQYQDNSRYYDTPPPGARAPPYQQAPPPAGYGNPGNPGGHAGRAPGGQLTLHVEKNKDQDSNICYVSDQDFPGSRGGFIYVYLALQGGVVVTAQAAPDVGPGTLALRRVRAGRDPSRLLHLLRMC